jgi:membrane associated rhomboid family serine protease
MLSALIPIKDVNPHRRFPLVTLILIGINVFAFIATAKGFAVGDVAAFRYGAVPCDVTGQTCEWPEGFDPVAISAILDSRPAFMTLLTSMFMHGDVLHIAFNMLFLWVFGNNVEDRLGRVRFPIFYFLTGLIAAYAHILFSANSAVPIVGASGAISGILGGYIVLWPSATIVSLVPLGFFFFTVRWKAWVTLGLWFLVQLFGGVAGLGRVGSSGGVAFLAHVGGFVAGLVLIIPFGGRRDPGGPGGQPLGDRRLVPDDW